MSESAWIDDRLIGPDGEELEITAVSTGSWSFDLRPTQPPELSCRVYWGSHGCDRPRGHEGPHLCLSCWQPDEDGWVGAPPYYGPDTNFYGEDVQTGESPDSPPKDGSGASPASGRAEE